MNRKQYIQENVFKTIHGYMQDPEGNPVDTAQEYADIISTFIPVGGNIADLASAGVDLAQGQLGSAAMRGVQAIPILGDIALAAKLGKKSRIGSALTKTLTSKPLHYATSAAPFVAPLIGGVKDGLAGEESTSSSSPQTTSSSPQSASQEASDSQELIRNFAANQIFGNRRQVKHGSIQTFESVSSDLARCIMEKETAKQRAARNAAERAAKRAKTLGRMDAEDLAKQGGFGLRGAVAPGLASAGLFGAAFGLPLAVGKLFGGDSSNPTGQGPGSGDEGPARGGVSTVLDRLSAKYGFISGFNPAGAAIGALGRRVGA
tara:strand:+ start:628 stop:1581 length:954 start_codon:yes stop_codon:yes gene_type:complete